MKIEKFEKLLASLHEQTYNKIKTSINPIQDVVFWSYSQMGGGGRGANRSPLPNISHTYSTMMKLAADIPYPKKIQKIYESSDILLEFY